MSRTLRVGFSKNIHNACFSVILQKYLNRKYSHCFIIYDTVKIFGQESVYHSSISSGVGYITKERFEEDNEIVLIYEVEVSDEAYSNIRKNLFSVCGVKYGLMQNLGIAIVDLMKHFNIRIKNPFCDNINCSELLYREFVSKMYPEYSFDPDTVTPRDIEDVMKKIGVKVYG